MYGTRPILPIIAGMRAARTPGMATTVSKAFTRESDQDDADDDQPEVPALPAGTRNYITPGGRQRLRDELAWLLDVHRPNVTAVVAWAAGNGDRSENADYQYGKRRLREIDRRIRFLTRRLDLAEVVDPAAPRAGAQAERVFFGATVTYEDEAGEAGTVTIVGVDEIDLARRHVSWVSPLARALMKARAGDTVVLHSPGGTSELTVMAVRYGPVAVAGFVPVPTSFEAAAGRGQG